MLNENNTNKLSKLIGYGLTGLAIYKLIQLTRNGGEKQLLEYLQKLVKEKNGLNQDAERVKVQESIPDLKELKEKIKGIFESIDIIKSTPLASVASRSQVTYPSAITIDSDKIKWLEVIKHPCRITILGAPGTGKSALAHYLMEILHWKLPTYIVGFPKNKEYLLPPWLGIVKDLDSILLGSVNLIDEAYLLYSSRESLKNDSKSMSKALGLFRQRQCTLIFVGQESRLIDRNIISSTDVLIFKDPGFLQVGFDRPELRRILCRVREEFNRINKDKRTWAYVYSPWFEGLLRCYLPSYWSNNVSRAYAYQDTDSDGRIAKLAIREEKKKMAQEIYATGRYSYKMIAKILGCSKATVINWVKHNY